MTIGATMHNPLRGDRGVALLLVMLLIAGLLILGDGAMLLMDNVAKRSGQYRQVERSEYCAEEGLNLARAWLLNQMGNAPQVDPRILGTPGVPGLLADPTDATDLASNTKDLCQIAPNPGGTLNGAPFVGGLLGICRNGSNGNPAYRINLVDDIDESPVLAKVLPLVDQNQVFILRAECLSNDAQILKTDGTHVNDVAMIEVNQSGVSNCYPASNNGAGCGGGPAN